MELEEIRSRLRTMLPHLGAKYAVDKLWVFGSRVRGQGREDSDLDVLVEFKHRGFSLLEFIALEQEIQDELGLKVDLVDRSAVRDELRSTVFPEALAV